MRKIIFSETIKNFVLSKEYSDSTEILKVNGNSNGLHKMVHARPPF